MTKPFTGLTPMLESDDLMRTLKFYTEVLGFECKGRWPEDAPCWLSLRCGDIEVAFSNRNEHRREFAATATPLLTGSLYFYTNEVEAWWERLRERVTVEYPLETFDYGMREFAIRDDCGYLLQFGQDVTG
ncbi:MAG: VOC family protein [Acidobacteria bacterium]|nr:VOC family protein [Acidobacteriota bacterium]